MSPGRCLLFSQISPFWPILSRYILLMILSVYLAVLFPDEFAGGGDLLAEGIRLQDLDFASLAENPADDLVFNSGFERNDEGAVGLRLDLKLLDGLVFAEIERDGRVAQQSDIADPGVDEEAVPAGLLNEFFVGHKCVTRKNGFGNTLDSIDFGFFFASFVSLQIPHAVAEREEVRLEEKDCCFSIRDVIRQLDDLMLTPGVENSSKNERIDGRLDSGGTEDGLDHRNAEERVQRPHRVRSCQPRLFPAQSKLGTERSADER